MSLALSDEGSGRPLVFVHGMSADRAHWGPVADLLRDRFRCIRVDMPGHGESPREHMDTIGAAQELQRTLEELEVQAPVVVGHSAGAYVAVVFGLLAPASGVVGADDPRHIPSFAARLVPYAERLHGDEFETAFMEWLDATYPSDRIPEPYRTMAVQHLRPRKEVVLSYWSASMGEGAEAAHKALTDALPGLSAPFLGIYGSALTEVEREVIDRIPNATVEVWDGVGHFVQLVDPQRFADRIERFVAPLGRPSEVPTAYPCGRWRRRARGGCVSEDNTAGWRGVVPINEFIGLDVPIDAGDANLELPISDRVAGWGPVHGGVLALLADTCCAAAVATVIDQTREMPATTDLHVRYFKQPRESPLRAKGVVVNRGSRSVAAECEIRDGQDRLVAKATGSYTLFEFQKRTDIRPG